jgi:hypothetical protein
MHGPINVKSPYNISKWQIGFNSAFKGLTHIENPTRRNSVSKFYFIFIWSSTCFGRHTTHHQGPKTALAASGFAYVEGCWTLYNLPKHVEWYSLNSKIAHLVVFTIEIYHDARSHDRQIWQSIMFNPVCSLQPFNLMHLYFFCNILNFQYVHLVFYSLSCS